MMLRLTWQPIDGDRALRGRRHSQRFDILLSEKHIHSRRSSAHTRANVQKDNIDHNGLAYSTKRGTLVGDYVRNQRL